jgi:hypothetical protein
MDAPAEIIKVGGLSTWPFAHVSNRVSAFLIATILPCVEDIKSRIIGQPANAPLLMVSAVLISLPRYKLNHIQWQYPWNNHTSDQNCDSLLTKNQPIPVRKGV